MKVSTIRFSERLGDLIAQAAEAEGVSFAQFVREAALIRLVYLDFAGIDDFAAVDRKLQEIREMLAQEAEADVTPERPRRHRPSAPRAPAPTQASPARRKGSAPGSTA